MSLYNLVFFTFEQLTRIARGSKGRAKKPSDRGGGGGGGCSGQGLRTRPVRGLLEATKIGPCVSFAKCMHQTGGHGCCFFWFSGQKNVQKAFPLGKYGFFSGQIFVQKENLSQRPSMMT